MNILYLIYFDGSRKTGHAAHARGLAKGLEKIGVNLTVAAPNWPKEKRHKTKFCRVPHLKRRGLMDVSFLLSCLVKLPRIIYRANPDVIYARYFKLLFVLQLAFKVLRIPVIIEYNASVRTENKIYDRGLVSSKLHIFSEALSLYLSNHNIYVSEVMMQEWTGLSFKNKLKFSHIANGYDDDIYFPKDKLKCREYLGLPVDRLIIGYVGSDSEEQGLDCFILAYKDIVKINPDIFAVIVGVDRERKVLNSLIEREQIARNILIVPPVDELVASCYINGSDICIAPYSLRVSSSGASDQPVPYRSPMKGNPLKIYSYMGCGKPIVASHFDQAGAFLEDIGAGIATGPSDVSDLTSKILYLISDEEVRLKMGLVAANYSKLNCTWDQVAKKTYNIAASLIT